MRSCKEISKLVSSSLDRKLSFRDRIEVWMHLKMCRLCGAFWRDLRRLRSNVRGQIVEKEQDESICLNPSSKARIQAEVNSRIGGDDKEP
ncbi:zf-HC2 domain-containing protein [Stieleria varia]